MITQKLYLDIAKAYGTVASWAVWEKSDGKPKSNISNMNIFDIEKNANLLRLLHVDTVMVGLNFARKVEMCEPFLNFHDSNPHGQDFKIRYAFEGTQYYGSYMTDIIKNFPKLSSKDVVQYLKGNPQEVTVQIDTFLKELEFIGSVKPTILTFGKDTYSILKDNLRSEDCSDLIPLTHYSHQISKENYKKDVHMKLGIANDM